MNIAGYRKLLDPVVQAQSFRRQPGLLGHLAAHLLLVTGLGLFAATHVASLPFWALVGLGVLAGHSVGILAFVGHEIGHGAVVAQRQLRWLTGCLAWTYGLFTNTAVQGRAHNLLHHGHGNALQDPDRRPTLDEAAKDWVDAWVATWIFPNSRTPWCFGLLGFHASLCGYHIKLLTHSLARTGSRFDTRMPPKVRALAAFEFLWSASVYLALWALAGFSPWMALYLWVMYATATTVDGLYIATNHLLCGYDEHEHDPVQQTVSLKLPAWIDFLHLRFSHHTEHHLYPTAGPAHYPVIRQALRTHFADRYLELTMPQAIRLLFQSPLAIAGPNALADVDGKGERPVRFALNPSPAPAPSPPPPPAEPPLAQAEPGPHPEGPPLGALGATGA